MDRKEFGNLILENERQLYRIAKSILRSDEDCADAAPGDGDESVREAAYLARRQICKDLADPDPYQRVLPYSR